MKKFLFYAFISLCSLQVFAQERTITGTVIDAADGTTLPGVNVFVQGNTLRGVSTDFDGKYSIDVPAEGAYLEFSFVGYANQVFLADDLSTLDVSMEQAASQLDEIVVIGYGSIKKRNVTGAVVSLGDDEMNLGAATVNAAQAIQGRAAGVEVSANDGEPGQAMSIVIRGNTSISNSNQPLYVVDGFPIDAGVSIAPEDIATIDILKDAASAAIYGSRGSAGVILITTKKGKEGKTEISLDGYAGIQSMNGEVPYIPWSENSRVVNEQYEQGGTFDGDPWYNAADIALPNDTDWLEATTRDAKIQNYTLRASGGDQRSHFSLSTNYFKQEGIFLNSDFNRVSLRLNADRKMGKKVVVGMNIYTSKIDANALDKRPGSRSLSPLYAILRASPGRAAYNEDGSLAHTVFSRDTRRWLNPIGLLTERENNYEEWRTYSNVYIDYNIIENLTARLNVGFDHTAGTTAQYQPQEYSLFGTDPYGAIDHFETNSYLAEFTADYKFNFDTDVHDLSILGGTSTQYDDLISYGLQGLGFPTDKTLYYNLGSATNQTIYSGKSDKRLISFFGRATYHFKQKWLFTATVRADGASQFGENSKWGTFPSASAGWIMSEEEFMSGSVVSNLKLRASYGQTGNNGISPYTSLARVGPTAKTYTYDGNVSGPGLGSDGVFAPNPDLKWETTAMFNFGVDFGFWNNRLYGTLEVYNSTTDDLIIDKPLSQASTGFSVIRANVGSMKNSGIEFTVGGRIFESSDRNGFRWTSDLNMSTNDNEITKLNGDQPINLGIARQPYGEVGEEPYRRLVEGGKIGDFFGYTYRGVLQPGEVYPEQPNTTLAGSALYEDISGPDGVPDGIITADDRTVIGNANPDFIWGWNNHFEIAGVYLDMFWQGVAGNDLFNFKAIAADRFLSERALDRWSPQNTDGTRPGVDYFANQYGSYVNTEFFEDGSYVRLKNLAIGYNLNTDKMKGLSGLNVYIQGQNLITITDYTGYDPETSFNYNGTQTSVNRGVDDYGYPNYKTWTIGLKLTF